MSDKNPSFLEVLSGPYAGRKASLHPGSRLTVGRARGADFAIPDDLIAALQFAIEPLDDGYQVRDLASPRGTYLNGVSITVAPLCDQDAILAGLTHFLVHLEGVAEAARHKPPLSHFLERRQPLYAVLDAARSPQVLGRLRASPLRYEILLEGERAEQLADYAPYLVELPADAALLETLAQEGWGRSWGVFCVCAESEEILCEHLRSLLWAETPDGTLFFRFYDPRVLRDFLPTCAAGTAERFFGPVEEFLTEAEDPEVILRFTRSATGVEREAIRLNGPA